MGRNTFEQVFGKLAQNSPAADNTDVLKENNWLQELEKLTQDSPAADNIEELEENKWKKMSEDAEIQRKDAELQSMRIANVSSFMDIMTKLDPNWTKDTQVVSQTQNLLENIMFDS